MVVPCYRSVDTLPELVRRLVATLGDLDPEFEIILVIDGSPDSTAIVAADLARADGSVVAMELSRNFGQHNALVAGIRMARHDVIVTMDDDLQHPPEALPQLLAALSPSIDLVYGVAAREEHDWLRSFASRSVKWLMARSMGVRNATEISAFRIFRAELNDVFASLNGPSASVDVALSWATARIGAVPVPMAKRVGSSSNYSFRMLVRHAVTMILGFSSAPLRLVGYLGFACALLGAALLSYVLSAYLRGNTNVAGFTTLASMIALFSGAQMLAIGVLGEYLASVHSRTLGRPTYVVRRVTRRR